MFVNTRTAGNAPATTKALYSKSIHLLPSSCSTTTAQHFGIEALCHGIGTAPLPHSLELKLLTRTMVGQLSSEHPTNPHGSSYA